MKSFKLGQRVWLRRVGRDAEHEAPMNCVGTVVRLLRRDDSAWVALDVRDPSLDAAGAFPFPADDEYGRGTHVLAWPDDCERAL